MRTSPPVRTRARFLVVAFTIPFVCARAAHARQAPDSEPPAPPATSPSQSAPAPAAAPLPWTGEETLEVELRTVPFYAVDAAGRPVYDLAPDEVRLTVGGRPVVPDTFDRYATSAEASSAAASGSVRPPSLARHVFFLFDQAFTSGAGLARSREIALGLLDRLPAGDRLYLLTNHSQSGFSQRLGPLAADPAGKAALGEAIDALLPNVERLRTRAEQSLPAMDVGARNRAGAPAEQVHNFYDAIGGLGRIEYRASAETLAAGLETLASYLRGLAGSKLLLVFSDGVESRMYFDGDYAGEGLGTRWTAGSSGMYHVDSRRFPPILHRFEGPLRDLAAAGALPVFVNPSGDRSAGNGMVHHMSEVTGGLFLDETDPRFVEDRIAGATAAYYEAGFYPGEHLDLSEKGVVEVEVLRPGVRAWSPKRLQSRQAYRGLGRDEREYRVVDLVLRGLEEAAPSGGARAAVDALPGRVGGSAVTGKRQLLFEGQAPREVRGKRLDLYNVVIRVHHGGVQPQLVKLERRGLPPAEAPFRVATELPSDGAYIWGIVAVEPASGATYFRRLLLEAPLATADAGPSGRQEKTP